MRGSVLLFSTPLCSGMRVVENVFLVVLFSLFANTRSAAEGCRKSTVEHAKTSFVDPPPSILSLNCVVFGVCFYYVFAEASGAGF